jgi:asparagine synthase (glutamine-hydrolysing)
MCGIAGFVGNEIGREAPERAAILDSMCRVIAHRGPDDQGTWLDGEAALGMRRLAIIDLAGGRQPIANEDGQIRVVFNGEIYNYPDLRADLEAKGHRFQTRSDTEVIVHAYEELGPEAIQKFRGMFALAVWDAPRRTLLLARDRVGKKPLYYTTTSHGTLVFGSELKALLEHPEVRREISPEALDAYLALGYVPDPLCIFRDIHKLPPGCLLIRKGEHLSVGSYWDFEYAPVEPRSEREYREELLAELEDAVRARLVADVPLGAFLSGGIDSSTVVGLMARQGTAPVKTFSIGFHEDSYNELEYARRIARHYGTEHHELIVTPRICQEVDRLVWHFDEPFADQSALPTFAVASLAREHVTVVLSGDGGDELFAGYTRYARDRRRERCARLPRALRYGVMRPLARRLPHGAWGRNSLHCLAADFPDRYIESISLFTSLTKRPLYTHDFHQSIRDTEPVSARMRRLAGHVRTGARLDSLLYLDSKTYLPGDILTKVDRMTMAVSLEARAPLLDHKLIEAVTRIPAASKLRGGTTKHILRETVRGLVPDEILDRPKMGFGVPIEQWITAELRGRIHETLTEARTRQRGYFDPAYVRLLLEEHERGRRDHSAPLWALWMLELWHRTFMDSPVERAPLKAARSGDFAPAKVPL